MDDSVQSRSIDPIATDMYAFYLGDATLLACMFVLGLRYVSWFIQMTQPYPSIPRILGSVVSKLWRARIHTAAQLEWVRARWCGSVDGKRGCPRPLSSRHRVRGREVVGETPVTHREARGTTIHDCGATT